MFTVEQVVVIKRPPADVFAFLTDHTNDPLWRSDLIATRRTSSGVLGVGESFQATVKFLGRQTSDYRVTVYEQDRREEFEAISGPLRSTRFSSDLSATDEGTAVRYRLKVQLNGLFRLAGPVMPRLFQKQLGDFLTSLKRVLETKEEVPSG
jgi:hypothetical protein